MQGHTDIGLVAVHLNNDSHIPVRSQPSKRQGRAGEKQTDKVGRF